jgi:hypothetical protein
MFYRFRNSIIILAGKWIANKLFSRRALAKACPRGASPLGSAHRAVMVAQRGSAAAACWAQLFLFIIRIHE